jgi:hypothetical protein
MEFTRHMFINYDEVDAVLEVEAHENIGVFAMRFEGDEIEELVTTWEVPEEEESVRFEVVVPAGAVQGFGAYSAPRTSSRSERLTMLAAAGKNPWPTPPPPPGLARDDFEKRYANFLQGLAGEGEVPVQAPE